MDIENMFFDVVMNNEDEFKLLQVPWHFGEETFNRTVPALRETGQVDEYLLKVLSKLIWFQYTVDDVSDLVFRETDNKHKVRMAKCMYQALLESFNESSYVLRVKMVNDIIRGENHSGDAVTAWLKQMDQRLPEQPVSYTHLTLPTKA